MKVISQPQCLKHDKYHIQYLNTNPKNSKDIQLCPKCIQFSLPHFNSIDLVMIDDIMNYDKSEILDNWPPLNVVKQLKIISQQSFGGAQLLKEQIGTYFEQFQSEINAAINECQKRMIAQIDTQETQIADMISKYKVSSFLEDFNFEQKLQSFMEIIEKWNEHPKKNINSFNNNLEQSTHIKCFIDYQHSNLMKRIILQSIEQLDILSFTNNNLSDDDKALIKNVEELNNIKELKSKKQKEHLEKLLSYQFVYQCNLDLLRNLESKIQQEIKQCNDTIEKPEQKYKFIDCIYKELQEYQSMEQQNLNNQNIIQMKFSKNYHLVSDFNFEYNQNYILRITFIPSSSKKGEYAYYIGLIEEQQLSQKKKTYNHCSFSTSNNQNSETIKGDLYNSDLRQIEIQLCIEQNTFKVCSYPDYQNIEKLLLDKSTFNNNTLRLGIQFTNNIQDVIIMDCFTVDKFEDLSSQE